LIPGEPGIGKSRLAVALRRELARDAYCPPPFQCSSYHTSSAWHPIIRHLEHIVGIDREMSPEVKLSKLEWLIEQLEENAAVMVPLLAELLSIPADTGYAPLALTPQQQKQETLRTILTLLESYGKRQPVLLVFEDVHWIDPTSLELLGHIAANVPAWRALILVLLRPELIRPWTEHPHVASLSIGRLDRVQAQSMIGSVAGEPNLPTGIVEQIVTKSDGVPLFIEEMTKAVIEASQCATGEGSDGGPALVAVPDTLHDSLMARLDQLNPVKTIAQIAAVIGREFSLKLIETIAPFPKREVHAAIDRLIASGLVFRTGHSRNEHFTFKH